MNEIYQKTIAILRSLSCYYQTTHWLASGSQYYGDHLLLQRLYDAVTPEIDVFGEKALGITKQDSAVNLIENISMVSKIINNMEYGSVEICFKSALKLERAFVMFCEEQSASNENSEGVKNLFAGTADIHEGHVYLLQQRVSGVF